MACWHCGAKAELTSFETSDVKMPSRALEQVAMIPAERQNLSESSPVALGTREKTFHTGSSFFKIAPAHLELLNVDVSVGYAGGVGGGGCCLRGVGCGPMAFHMSEITP